MGEACCVEGCVSNDSTHFKFPTAPSLKRKWLEALRVVGKLTVSSVVCSVHFREEDYEFIRGKTRLKGKVVPSLQCGGTLTDENSKNMSNSKENGNTDMDLNIASTRIDKYNPIVNDTRQPETNDRIQSDDKAQKQSTESSPKPPQENVPSDQDIEDIITNYHIPQLKKPVTEQPVIETAEVRVDTVDLDKIVSVEPTFIEVAQGSTGADDDTARDCLMLMEDVQVEVDPTLLLEMQEYDEDKVDTVEKGDPISLLTSSDEDDVIIQEPNIDTVEVSDETDEDDVPLVNLVRTKKKLQIKYNNFLSALKLAEIGIANHARALHICSICSYTTSSKGQFSKHKKKHREERRYRCHLCSYKAKHNMSLLYHMKTHGNSNVCLNQYKCGKCKYVAETKSKFMKHEAECSLNKRFRCQYCSYDTKRRSDLKRHILRKHCLEEDGDDDYIPPATVKSPLFVEE